MSETDEIKTKRFAKSVKELASFLPNQRKQMEQGISTQAAHGWINKPGFPQKTGRGFDVAKCIDFVADAARAEVAGDGSLKDRKTLVEIEILETKRDQLRGELIALEDYHRELREIAGVFNGGLDQFISVVSADFRDSRAVELAEGVRDRIRAWMKERFHGIADHP